MSQVETRPQSVETKWMMWQEVWELYLASIENEIIDTDTDNYVKSKTLKPLFLLKIGEKAREIYNSKRKADSSDKLTEKLKFMSERYAAKPSVFACVSIFYKAKRHEGESVKDYMVRLRHLAGPYNNLVMSSSERLFSIVALNR